MKRLWNSHIHAEKEKYTQKTFAIQILVTLLALFFAFPIFMIDKCFIPRHFCRTVAGKGHTLLNLTQKDTESG